MAQHEPVLRAVAVFYAAAGGILTPPCGGADGTDGGGERAARTQLAVRSRHSARGARRLIAHLC